ncbi:MAG: hypothetical protein CM15mP58_18590 [Burkholderiaceae bacterium]|nr:MAG: hypothetical protein CM15mP58_18590 [Burkholderiaceae bacterium]
MDVRDDSSSSDTVWEQKSQMLTNWADNFIIPNYQNLSDKLSNLENSVAPSTQISLQSLEDLRDFGPKHTIMATRRNV